MNLMQGDCLERMKEIKTGSVDLTVTSPPYDNLRTYKDSLDWGEHVWKPVLEELFRVTKQGGVVVWVVGDATIKGSETGTSFKQALYAKECGFNLHDTMIYNRYAQFTSNVRYSQDFEYMFIFSKDKPKTINLIQTKCKPHGGNNFKLWNRDSNTIKYRTVKRNKIKPHSNIFKYNRGNNHSTKDKNAYKHPATFPELLAHDHIISWSNEGDTVLDPMIGSGTTLKMAEKLNRRWIGIEIEEKYCEIAAKRIEKERSQLKLFT